jgi:hypothetical protein
MSKWSSKGLHDLSTSLTSEVEVEDNEAVLSKWLDFETYLQISFSDIFINLITSNLRLHGFKYLEFGHPEDLRL